MPTFHYTDNSFALFLCLCDGPSPIAADKEGFLVELFKLNILILYPILPVLFNRVVCTGFPPSWSRHVVYLIHKFRLALDPHNYKIISIGHTFSKLYAMVLNIILTK